MKRLSAAGVLAATLSAVNAAPYAPQEFDFSELALEGNPYGFVECVREVQYKGFLNAVEHAVQPVAVDEMRIRLDDGRAVILRREGMQRFEPGQRVRLVSATTGTRVERHD
jgi:hypothetical protein